MVIFDEIKYIKTPTISIIVIVYNHEKYISQCLDNILSQVINVEYEIIIGDDYSTDSTREICKSYQVKYPNKIKLIFNDTNLGLIKNYKSLLDSAIGKYVAQISGDDFWCDNYKLQKQFNFMEKNINVGLCYTDYDLLVDSTGEIKNKMFENYNNYRPITYEQHLLQPGFLAPMTWLYRNNIVKFEDYGQVDESYTMMLEWMKNSSVAYIPESTAVYRVNAGSASLPKTIDSLYIYVKGVFDIQRKFLKKYNAEYNFTEKVLMKGYLDVLPIAIKAGKIDFVKEVKVFFETRYMNINVIIRELQAGHNRLNSRAYRLGKILLTPFYHIKKYLK